MTNSANHYKLLCWVTVVGSDLQIICTVMEDIGSHRAILCCLIILKMKMAHETLGVYLGLHNFSDISAASYHSIFSQTSFSHINTKTTLLLLCQYGLPLFFFYICIQFIGKNIKRKLLYLKHNLLDNCNEMWNSSLKWEKKPWQPLRLYDSLY